MFAQEFQLPKGMVLEEEQPQPASLEEWTGWRDEQRRRMQKKGRGMGPWEVDGLVLGQ